MEKWERNNGKSRRLKTSRNKEDRKGAEEKKENSRS